LRYIYDPLGRLTKRWSAAKDTTKYKFDSVGNLTNIDYPVSTDISFASDPLNRLTTINDASARHSVRLQSQRTTANRGWPVCE